MQLSVISEIKGYRACCEQLVGGMRRSERLPIQFILASYSFFPSTSLTLDLARP